LSLSHPKLSQIGLSEAGNRVRFWGAAEAQARSAFAASDASDPEPTLMVRR